MNTNRLALSLLPTVILATSVMLLLTAGTAYAGKPDKCSPWPACKDDGTEPPPDPDPGSSPDPQVVYRDDGIFLANDNGTNRTLVRTSGVGPKLDAINERVLFIDEPSYGSQSFVGMIPYTINTETGNIDLGEEQALISAAQLGGTISPEGVSDWSPDGSKYSYSYRTQAIVGGPWIHRMVVAPDPEDFPLGAHTEVYASEDDGGLNSATWDASGDFIYHQDAPLDGSMPGGLFVIDVSASPGRTVAAISLGSIMAAHGFPSGWNVQSMSASYEIGFDQDIGGNPDAYSFDPGNPNVPATSDTSLCLMISAIDWSAPANSSSRFIVILDLVQTFDPVAWGNGLHCSIATVDTPILDFQGNDFTTGDAGIIGPNSVKGKPGAIWIHDLDDGTRTEIFNKGGYYADWSN
jgi:hypothetical protein